MVAHGDTREGKWKGIWRMEWVANTLHTTSEHGVSSITTTDTHSTAASSWLNWRPRRFKWIRPFRRKTKSGLCACAITFQTQSASIELIPLAARSKAWVYDRLLVGIAGSNPAVGVMPVSCECCVEIGHTADGLHAFPRYFFAHN